MPKFFRPMKAHVNLLFLLVLVVMVSCKDGKQKTEEKQNHGVTKSTLSNPEIAQGFRVTKADEIRMVEIFSPGDSIHPNEKFYLVKHGQSKLAPGDGKVIETPVSRIVCLSASQLSYLDALDDIAKLVGVSNADYVVSKEFKGLVESGQIKETGLGEHFKTETLISLAPDIVMVSPQKGQSFQVLENAGLTVLPIGDYLESHPLGRAEWIKLFGLLSGKEDKALQIFDSIKQQYEELKMLAANIEKRPSVITGKQYGGFWNLSGGKSYEAQFLLDAGAHYLWADEGSAGGLMLDFETVYHRGFDADYWRFLVYSPEEYTYTMLQAEDKRYTDFRAFRTKKIITCNTLKKPFFQKGFLEPQVILADYMHIFHPSLLPDYTPVYYDLMK
jgi:iron complex transport system substrate-binding protein